MSPADVAALLMGSALLLVGVPLFALAARRLRRVVPAVPPAPARWSLPEALLVLAAPFVVPALAGAFLDGRPGTLAALILSQLALGAGAALALLLAARRPQGLWSLGLVARPGWSAVPAVVLAWLPLLVSVLGLGGLWRTVCRAFGWEEGQEVIRAVLELRGAEFALALLLAVVLGPLIEELFFRGFLLAALAQPFGERRALWAASAVFAALHGEVAVLPIVFALALFLGWLQQRARCLYLPWLAHALFNGCMLGLALAQGDG